MSCLPDLVIQKWSCSSVQKRSFPKRFSLGFFFSKSKNIHDGEKSKTKQQTQDFFDIKCEFLWCYSMNITKTKQTEKFETFEPTVRRSWMSHYTWLHLEKEGFIAPMESGLQWQCYSCGTTTIIALESSHTIRQIFL